MQTLSYWQSIKEPGTIKLQSSKCVIGREKKKLFWVFAKELMSLFLRQTQWENVLILSLQTWVLLKL